MRAVIQYADGFPIGPFALFNVFILDTGEEYRDLTAGAVSQLVARRGLIPA